MIVSGTAIIKAEDQRHVISTMKDTVTNALKKVHLHRFKITFLTIAWSYIMMIYYIMINIL